MSLLGYLPQPLGLIGVLGEVAAKAALHAIEQKKKEEKKPQSTASRDLALLEGAKERGLLNAAELSRVDLSQKLLGKIVHGVCNISNKIVDRAGKAGPSGKKYLCAVSQIMENAGIEKCRCEPLIDGLQSKDKTEKQRAALEIKRLISENVDTFAKVKLIVDQAAEVNSKTKNKISGLEKIRESVERYERHISQLLNDFRGRIGDAPKRLFVNEASDPKAEVKEVPRRPVQEFRSSEGNTKVIELKPASALMMNAAVESLQKVKELLVDIEEIKQEIEFLHSRVKPFEAPDPLIGIKLSELEEEEEDKKSQLNFHLAQYSWNSPN